MERRGALETGPLRVTRKLITFNQPHGKILVALLERKRERRAQLLVFRVGLRSYSQIFMSTEEIGECFFYLGLQDRETVPGSESVCRQE